MGLVGWDAVGNFDYGMAFMGCRRIGKSLPARVLDVSNKFARHLFHYIKADIATPRTDVLVYMYDPLSLSFPTLRFCCRF